VKPDLFEMSDMLVVENSPNSRKACGNQFRSEDWKLLAERHAGQRPFANRYSTKRYFPNQTFFANLTFLAKKCLFVDKSRFTNESSRMFKNSEANPVRALARPHRASPDMPEHADTIEAGSSIVSTRSRHVKHTKTSPWKLSTTVYSLLDI
jgi:hypothetical protein